MMVKSSGTMLEIWLLIFSVTMYILILFVSSLFVMLFVYVYGRSLLLSVPKELFISWDIQFVLLVLRTFCLLYPAKTEPKKIAYSVVNGTIVCDRWENRRIRLAKWVYTTVCIRFICVIYTYCWPYIYIYIWIDRRDWTLFNLFYPCYLSNLFN